ncbi:hypothetical protein ccbrp13_35800 [Ktedonobacteria bacterium brp13]|nr:hypothetical protein ccbrp13_35800 [Ktedonobacteria bacterium brp13]
MDDQYIDNQQNKELQQSEEIAETSKVQEIAKTPETPAKDGKPKRSFLGIIFGYEKH